MSSIRWTAKLLLLAFLSIAGLGITGISAAWADAKVTGVRIGDHPDKTRFVLELSQDLPYRVFTLPDPFRVVIDMPAFKWQVPAQNISGQNKVIKALRHGLFAPGASRIVLDVAQPIELSSVFVLPPGENHAYRFVVDIKPVSRQSYLAAKAKPVVSKIPFAPGETAVAALPPATSQDSPKPLVVIDAGHGGVDPGAIGVSGTHEKDLTLAYALALKQAMEATGRYRVAMTREQDQFLKLRDRVQVAQKSEADLFISLHANSHRSRGVQGASVYTLSEKASDAEAAKLAAAENEADLLAGIDFGQQPDDVREILFDLAQRETMNLSKRFADTLVTEIGKKTKLLRNTHRFAGFVVLKSPTVPSVLLEIGYMSNPEEERLLKTEKHRNKIINSAVQAIDNYFIWQKSVSRS
ncbi:MAG: N-acetylmuramoyl-L-alanine amidase [Pseudomonadota bacterium]